MGKSDTFRQTSETKFCPVCGEKFLGEVKYCQQDHTELVELSSDPLIGQRLNERYLILEYVNSGGWGSVYKAKDVMMDRLVAVKLLHAHLATDANQLKRFQQEIQTSSKLNHPNICTVYDCGIYNDISPYLVMEYLEGDCLDMILASDEPISVRRCVSIFSQVCSALAEAHRFQLVHRDIKPSNIMLMSEDRVKVLDFGLAKFIAGKSERLSSTGEIYGTLQYMSPEQLKGGNIDARSDIYSLGCVLYEALSGKKVCASETPYECIIKHVQEPPVPLEVSRPDLYIPTQMRLTVSKALEKNPADRFQTAQEFESALQASLTGVGLAAKGGAKKLVATTASVLIAAGMVAGIAFAWQQWSLKGRTEPKLAAHSGIAVSEPQRLKVPEDKTSKPTTTLAPGGSALQERKNVIATAAHSHLIEPRPHSLAATKALTTSQNPPPAKSEHAAIPTNHQFQVRHITAPPALTTASQELAQFQAPAVPKLQRAYTKAEVGQKPHAAAKPPTLVAMATAPPLICHGSWTRAPLGTEFADPNSDDDDAAIIQGLKRGDFAHLAILNVADSTRVSDALLLWVSQNCRQLKGLNISNTSVTARGLACLRSLKNLIWLTSFHCKYGDEGFAIIASLPNLTSLRIGGAQLSNAGLAQLASGHLHFLGIGRSQFTSGVLDVMAKMPDLSHVELDNCRFSNSSIGTLARSGKLKRLKLSSKYFDDQTLATAVSQINTLNYLELAGSSVHDAGVLALAALPNLRTLDISHTAVVADRIVDQLVRFPRLKEVIVSSATSATRSRLESASIKVSGGSASAVAP